MPWWLVALAFVGSTVLSALLTARPNLRNAPPSGLGDFRFPTAEEGRAIPHVYGTCYVKAPNVLWYGDLDVVPIKERIDGGPFASDKEVRIGHHYFMSTRMGICAGPIDELIDIRFDDRPIPVGAIRLTALNNQLRIHQGGATVTATVPAGTYTDLDALALAIETAMKTASPGNWKVVFGWHIVPSITDELRYAVQVSGVATNYTVRIAPGDYKDFRSFADAIAKALNDNEAALVGGARGTFSVKWAPSSVGIQIAFDSTVAGFEGLWIRGLSSQGVDYTKTANANLGFKLGADKFVATVNEFGIVTVDADYRVFAETFIFSFAGTTGVLKLSDSLFTIRQLLRLGSSDQTIGSYWGGSVIFTGVTYYPSGDYVRAEIFQPNLFGGEEREGGIGGRMDVFLGGAAQEPSTSYLAALNRDRAKASLSPIAAIPAYRRLCYAVQDHMYVGTSNYPKPVGFVVKRCPNGLGLTGGKHDIGGDSNPVATAYEILTETEFELGIPVGLLDTATFLAAADVAFAEGIGVSFIADSPRPARDILYELIRHLDAVLFEDPFTGLMGIKLARADYSVPGLPLADESNINNLQFERPSWEQTRNVVRVKYIDRDNGFTERIAQSQDLANIQARGGEMVAEELPFSGFSNAASAQKAADRALRELSFPSAKLEFDADRTLWALRPGFVFRLSDAGLGITDLPCRVTRIDPGTLLEGKLKVYAVEDVFGVSWTAYQAPQVPGWTDPSGPPNPMTASRAIEAPFAMTDTADALILTAGAPSASGVTLGYEIHVDPAGGENYALSATSRRATPSGTLTAGISEPATTMTLAAGPLMEGLRSITDTEVLMGRNVLLIDDEMIVWQYVAKNEDGTYTVSGLVRGVMDTVPAAHATSARAYFLTDGMNLARPTAYPLNATIAVKLLPYNRRGAVPIGESPAILIATGSAARAARPYAPTGLKINGVSYPEKINGAMTASWKHRNRLGDWTYEDAGETPAAEPGTHYRVKIYGETGVLKHTEDNISGLSYAYPEATEISESGLGRLNGSLRVTVECVVTASGLSSVQAAEDTFDRGGWGMGYGRYWGG